MLTTTGAIFLIFARFALRIGGLLQRLFGFVQRCLALRLRDSAPRLP